MKVETYEVENSNQTEAGAMAQDAEALELIERLGLEGQKRISDPKTTTRNPYRVMTKREQTVYKALLTQATVLEKYSDDAIPLRVLQVAAHAKECGLFERIEVWHSESATISDDPVLVGLVPGVEYHWMHTVHILARWGRELLNLEQLEASAVKYLRPKRVSDYQALVSKAQDGLQRATSTEDLEFLSHEPPKEL